MHKNIKEVINNILSEITIGQVKLQEECISKQTAIEFLELCRLEDQFKEYLVNIEKEEEGKKKNDNNNEQK